MSLKDLNAEQLHSVTHQNGPLLIVAGAGTGKTTVITERIAWLIEQKLAATDEILALTFTDKAAAEMEERVDRMLPYGYTDLWVMTFHAFAERLLQLHGLDIGLANDFKLLNQTAQWLLVRENLDKFNLDYYQPLGNPTKFIHALIKHFSRCKDEEIWPSDYLKYAEDLKINLDSMEATKGQALTKKAPLLNKEGPPTPVGGGGKKENQNDLSEINRLTEIANAYHIYQQLLLDNSCLDFGDLINYALKLFRTRPAILKKYQTQFKYLLVDEFQDTNFAQYELIKLLAGAQKNITVVGDDDQAIYKFRGASVSNILQFKTDFPESQEIFLNQNYRSSQNILDLAYNFIQLNNPERLEIKLKTQNQNNQKQLTKKLIAQTDVPGIIEYFHTKNDLAEANLVADKILELYQKSKNPSWNDFAILIRANSHADIFATALTNKNIPFNFIASKGLYSKEVILDIFNYLKLLDNYHESPALWRILNLPAINLPSTDLMTLSNLASRKAWSLYEALEHAATLPKIQPETLRKLNKLLGLLTAHTALAREKSVKTVVLQFLSDFNYQNYLLQKNDQASFIYLNQLLTKIDTFGTDHTDNSIKNFMNLINLELEAGEEGSLSPELAEGPEAVKIMTVHAAKGLEFAYVFIVNLVDKRFPSINRSDAIELPDALVKEIIPTGDVHLQEERRLFYVAMTRAKHGLFFTSAENYGQGKKKKLSRFLSEIGFSLDFISTPSLIKDEGWNPLTLKDLTTKISTKNLLNNNLPLTFSYSSLKAFATCPYQYYLNYIIKVPVKGKASFSYGKTMHATLQKFFSFILEQKNLVQNNLFVPGTSISATPAPLPPLEHLLKIYEQSWFDDWYESKTQKEQYKKQGQKSLKIIYQQLLAQRPNVIAVEKNFNLKLGNYTIRGVIDRIDEPAPNKFEIIDYKTGTAKNEKTVEKDQLLIYQIAAEKSLNLSPHQLTYYYLDDNTALSFLGTPQDLAKIKEKITTLIEQINQKNFTATPSEFICSYCDFKSICPHRA
ncbi:MAG TPA: UvrD-helicase domain-containing protein [bacterium]|nr:UvrD-helicase domain-containing protein [bacterium]HPL95795.1 UvrD-helicase domain-containing protein [bacterium]